MSADPPAVGGGGGAPKPPPPASPVARKLLAKLSSLHAAASLESRQTIASWMVFNRKKADGIAEGLARAVRDASEGDGGGDAARLMLLLRILHQVLVCDCPIPPASAAGADGGEAAEGGGAGDADKWEKASDLRTRLGEVVIAPLWEALAGALGNDSGGDGDAGENYSGEVKSILDEWKDRNVFGGPTLWEEYKRGWIRALKEASPATASTATAIEIDADVASSAGEGGASQQEKESPDAAVEESGTKSQPLEESQQSGDSGKSNDGGDQGDERTDGGVGDATSAPVTKDAASSDAAIESSSIPPPPAAEGSGDAEGKSSPRRASKIDSVADVEVDFEGVEAGEVEPSRFLDACKVIASIQITRDLGSDSAMNLSSALSSIPRDVEEACDKVLEQKRNGEDPTPITDLVSTDTLSKLPDEVLNLDPKSARQSLQSYRESIRQQRMARLQCLQLLLRSRCEFGSMDAARAFCGGEGDDLNMDAVLNKLKSRKEALVDAMALEGLDVEEDGEEEKLAKEEESLKPLSWFTEGGGTGNDEKDIEEDQGPAPKKLKI